MPAGLGGAKISFPEAFGVHSHVIPECPQQLRAVNLLPPPSSSPGQSRALALGAGSEALAVAVALGATGTHTF